MSDSPRTPVDETVRNQVAELRAQVSKFTQDLKDLLDDVAAALVDRAGSTVAEARSAQHLSGINLRVHDIANRFMEIREKADTLNDEVNPPGPAR